jgi:aminoglycoside/choline kinase family phosphotransferase
MSRDGDVSAFLATAGLGGGGWSALAQDASPRRYLRLNLPHRLVVMDAAGEDVRPFVKVQALLQDTGVSVPAIVAADPTGGFLLLEDFGDGVFPAVLTDANTMELYTAATRTLAVVGGTVAEGLPVWDGPAMAQAAEATFLDWWWPEKFGVAVAKPVREEFRAAMDTMLAPLRDGPVGFVHRDYFAGNLFWLPERQGTRRVGVIDFQDAALGHPAYDLVSLVQDSRRDLPPALMEQQMKRFLAQRPDLDRKEFAVASTICAVQRHLRVAGLWVRLARRDGKPGYLAHAPRTWRLLEGALAEPPAAPLRGFFERRVRV